MDIKGTEKEYLSVEHSNGYIGFREGYYIIVAGIYHSPAKAKQENNTSQEMGSYSLHEKN
jgi:hypothetical protein